MEFQNYFTEECYTTIPSPSTSCFDCNICLDFARDPVVTLCGHLFCWPCIYKWVDTQTASLPKNQLPRCPVCKAETSENTMVPLYGRGQSQSLHHEEAIVIPPRPPASGIQGLSRLSNHLPNQEPTLSSLGTVAPLVLSHPVGEMVYAWVFGGSESLLAYPNSYHSAGGSTPRLRRREMEMDKSLHRVSTFLFCCLLFCLFVF